MNAKQRRVGLMCEILNGITCIKYYAWESLFSDKLTDLRNMECSKRRFGQLYEACSSNLWAAMPLTVSVVLYLTCGDGESVLTSFTGTN